MRETIYKKIRNDLNMSRDEVCDYITDHELGQMTHERLERVENSKSQILPEEVILLSKVYKKPDLCNHYCTKECAIGKECAVEAKVKDLEKIILPMVASINSMKKSQERLIEIAADGIIDDEELRDFVFIQKELKRILEEVESLNLWTKQMIANEKINIKKYKELTEK